MEFCKYFVYGLGIQSQIPLWEPAVRDCPNDVTVFWHRCNGLVGSGSRWGAHSTGPDEITLEWPEVRLTVRGGKEVILETGATAELNLLRHLVNGIGLGIALHQRGTFTLHASAVAIGRAAVAIAGPKGAGKSTLAAALNARGHLLISDDVVALDVTHDAAPRVRPGPGNLNLWPDSAKATGQDLSALNRIFSGSPKLVGCLPSTTSFDPVPLSAVVILSGETSEAPLEMNRLPLMEAFRQLVSHSHALRWVDDAGCLPVHLKQCRAVLDYVPVFRLNRGPSLDSLAELAERIEGCSPARSPQRKSSHQPASALS